MLLTTLTACGNGDTPYVDCTIETCSQEMLVERIEVASTTTDGYRDEGKDAEEALIRLYDVTYDDIKKNKNYQYSIDSLEEEIEISDNSDSYASNIEKYVNAIIKCEGQCDSEFITYNEVKDLSTEEAIKLVKKRKPLNSSSPLDNILELLDGMGTFDSSESSTEKGTCKEVEGTYTSQGLSVSSCRYSSSKERISITVENNSGVDLRYLEVEIYGIDSNGKTVSSDYTNHSSTIRNGASQTLETYVDEAHSYEVEITKATPK